MQMFKEQVEAMRKDAQRVVEGCDRLLRALSSHAGVPTDGACTHPPERRLEAARMGAPHAWVCLCGQDGEEL